MQEHGLLDYIRRPTSYIQAAFLSSLWMARCGPRVVSAFRLRQGSGGPPELQQKRSGDPIYSDRKASRGSTRVARAAGM
jgi:hypothetical protein